MDVNPTEIGQCMDKYSNRMSTGENILRPNGCQPYKIIGSLTAANCMTHDNLNRCQSYRMPNHLTCVNRSKYLKNLQVSIDNVKII